MPSEKRIYLSPPHMGGNEQKYVKEAFDTNWVAPLGPNVDAFERSIAQYCNVEDAAALSSGTAAIHLALILLGVGRGDKVIAPSFTFSATVNPIVYLGAEPLLIDSEPGTWNMDPQLLEKALKDNKVKAIIVVHLYGMPADMTRIMDIADRYNVPVIEDAAEALGSKYNGRHVGTLGRIGILSFNGNKIITTSGGGALISNDKELVGKARFLSTQARDKAPHYQHSTIGYNYRMSNILAGIGRGQIDLIEERVRKKRYIFSFYREHLMKYEGISFLEEPSWSFFSNRWLTPVIIDPGKTGITRVALQEMLESHNIESRPLWKPMHLQPVFAQCPAFDNGVAESLFVDGLCLPSGTNMSDSDLWRVLHIIEETIKSAR